MRLPLGEYGFALETSYTLALGAHVTVADLREQDEAVQDELFFASIFSDCDAGTNATVWVLDDTDDATIAVDGIDVNGFAPVVSQFPFRGPAAIRVKVGGSTNRVFGYLESGPELSGAPAPIDVVSCPVGTLTTVARLENTSCVYLFGTSIDGGDLVLSYVPDDGGTVPSIETGTFDPDTGPLTILNGIPVVGPGTIKALASTAACVLYGYTKD